MRPGEGLFFDPDDTVVGDDGEVDLPLVAANLEVAENPSGHAEREQVVVAGEQGTGFRSGW